VPVDTRSPVAAILARWNALAPNHRIVATLLVAAISAAIAIGALRGRDDRVALFASPLHSEQVAEVVERLAAWNVSFAALPDNVRVDAERRNELLLKLSMSGIPHAHLGSSAEALSKAGPLTPEPVLEAQAREGLAGDLASGLRGVAGVDDAQVIVAPARDTGFADEAPQATTASVRLSLRPGANLPREALEGVRQFVAAGVPGLDPKRVAVLDDRGIALGADGTPGSEAAQGLETALQSVLDGALGSGSAIVRVHVAYDPRTREVRDVVRKPLGSRPIGTTTNDERFKSAGKAYAKTSASLDRGSEVRDERVDTPAGEVERISVAIAVDSARHADLAKVRSLALGTLGIAPNLGDAIHVEEVAFPHAPVETANVVVAALAGAVEALAAPAIFALAALVCARTGFKPLLATCEAVAQRLTLERRTRAVANFPPAQVRGALANEPPHTAAAIISALPAATATAVLEMYPPEERAAIVRRMSRPASPAVPDYETILRRG
jgi:flagellar biosynthesis/type III secretory pathway M-ring protein FliF/YscJ